MVSAGPGRLSVNLVGGPGSLRYRTARQTGGGSDILKYPSARALGLALGLFFAVYAPTFIAVSLIRPPAQIAVPLIIGLSQSPWL